MWFTENPWPPMLIAGLGALVCFGLWNSDKRQLYFFMAIGCLGLTGVIYGVERVIVTDGELLQEEVVQLCHQFQHREPATLDHFSQTADKLRGVCKGAMNIVEISDDLRLTDFRTNVTNQNSQATVHFRANATISAMGFKGHHSFRCILTYRKEAGSWKIVDVTRLDPIKGDKIDIMANE